MDTFIKDLLYAGRGLRKNPGFAAVATATIALGIGACTSIFSVVNAVLLRPLPYAKPGELITVGNLPPNGQIGNASFAEYKIPGMLDLPKEIINEAVTAEQRTGPFGGKGVGESGTFGVSPAIANAIHDAVGVRLTSLPLSPESIWEKLK